MLPPAARTGVAELWARSGLAFVTASNGGGCKALGAPYVERDRLAGTMLGHPHLLRFLLVMAAMWLDRRCEHVIAYLLEENRVLREQLPRRPRFTDAQRRRLARAARNLPRKTLHELDTIVTPDTLLRWYRALVAAKYDGAASRKLGRPHTLENLRALVVTMATENPTWGYTRIRGALLNLGHDLSCSTIARILKEEGISPAPNRKTTWRQFLRTPGRRSPPPTSSWSRYSRPSESCATPCSS